MYIPKNNEKIWFFFTKRYFFSLKILFLLSFLLLYGCKDKPKTISIGEQIRQARLKQNLSQSELAKAVGLDAANLSLIEDGLATPIRPKIEAIQNFLQTNFVWDSTATQREG
jgi:DNA-binding XRE family transcriptional regulator